MTAPVLSVVVLVWRHGREVVPTIRSIRRSSGVDYDLHIVCAPGCTEVVEAWLEDSRPGDVQVHRAASDHPGDLRARARGIGEGEFIALVDAGDLVGENWFSEGVRVARETGGMVHPEVVMTFGRRSGEWRQPVWVGDPALLRACARRAIWASPVVMRRETATRTPHPGGTAGDRIWMLDSLNARVHQVTAGRTSVFVRVWSDQAPWEPGEPLLTPVPLLTDLAVARSASSSPRPTPSRARRVAARLVRGARRRAGALARRVGLRRIRRSRSARFEPWLWRQWAILNEIEPLVPFPRADVADWYERVAPPEGDDPEGSTYWDLVSEIGATADYLFFAPWVKTGGADAVLLEYVRTVTDLDPSARVVVITTEPEASTLLGRFRGLAKVVELQGHLTAGVHRDAFVEWIVPQLIAQVAPHTVHAFNSTVAYDVIERYGDRLAPAARFFLSTFAIDRSDDGERLSVLFLRGPGFLAPVSAVLVDSARFVDRVVRDYGYPRDRFRVQRTPVPPRERASLGARPGPERLRVFWAGRFDLPKRLDILARVAARVREEGLPVDLHFYGEAVMGDTRLEATLSDLRHAGAVRHAPFERFDDLADEDYGAYLLTSEWEGVPLTLLDAMSQGIPVVAPLVGGVGEILDETTGFPVDDFDDIEAYVRALREILRDTAVAQARADAARTRIRAAYSMEHFTSALEELQYVRPVVQPSRDRGGRPDLGVGAQQP